MTKFDRDGTIADGIRVFAGIMLLIGGAFQVLQAVAALVHDEYILVLRNYILSLDLTVWGSIHLVVGLILGGDRSLPSAGQRLGQNRRPGGCRHLRCDQLFLAALRTGVGDLGHRRRRSRHLGPGHRRYAKASGATNFAVLEPSQGLIQSRSATGV